MAVEPLTRRSIGPNGVVFHRLPEVEAQIEECLALPWPELRKRLEIRKRAGRNFIYEEVAAYLCRRAHRERDQVQVEALWRFLLTRMDRFLDSALDSLDQQARSDAAIAIKDEVAASLFDLSTDRGDFLQVKFFHMLNRRKNDELAKQLWLVRRDQGSVSLDAKKEDADAVDELEPQLAGHLRGAAPPDQALHIREHLAKIEDPRHREAFVLRHRDGKQTEEIAAQMGVTVKTIYNWLTAAEETLAAVTGGSDAEAD